MSNILQHHNAPNLGLDLNIFDSHNLRSDNVTQPQCTKVSSFVQGEEIPMGCGVVKGCYVYHALNILVNMETFLISDG